MKGTRYTPQELRHIRARRRGGISWQRIGEELDRNPSALSTSRIVQAVLSGKASPDSPRIRRFTIEELRAHFHEWRATGVTVFGHDIEHFLDYLGATHGKGVV